MANLSDNLHFDISTSVIKQLGEQLISDEVTAIMELIKNSYDAEADWVKIDIEVNNKLSSDYHYNNTEGYIILEDNGEGMSLADINNRWLIISFSAKREQKEQGKINEGRRIPLGDKGLGRLSTQRIGKQIEIITGVANETVYHSLAYNWDDFDGKRKLSDVDVIYKTLPKAIGVKGTKVAITGLNNPTVWKRDAFDIFRSELSKMIFPVKEKRPFNVRLTLSGQKVDLDSLNEQLRKQAIGEYKLFFDGKKLYIDIVIKLSKLKGTDNSFYEKNIVPDNGKAFFSFLTDKKRNKREFLDERFAKFNEKNHGYFLNYKTEYLFEDISDFSVIDGDILIKANPGKFDGEILEYDIRGNFDQNDNDLLSLGEYKRLIENQVGVRIFRDGFGIKPYGMNTNDWLKLSSGQTSGASFYGLRPNNIIGYISISNNHNLMLTEKTDREGFIETPYSKNFFLITRKFTDEINLVIERVRRGLVAYKKEFANEKGGFNGSPEKAVEEVNNTSKNAKNAQPKVVAFFEKVNETSNKLELVSRDFESNPLYNQEVSTQERERLKKFVELLRELRKIEPDIVELIASTAKLDTNSDFILPQINILKKQLIDFSELAGLGLTAEAWSHEILNILERISSQTHEIDKYLKTIKDVDTSIFIYVEQVKSVIQNLRIQVNHFSPSLKYNREKKESINISTFIHEVKRFFQIKFQKIGGEIEVILKEDFSIRANKGKLTQVLDNLLLNSEYWLKQKKLSNKNFIPKVFIEINHSVIKIWDNGNGISEAIEETIFQPFVTTKPVGEGRGLGLYIVEQIIESMGGEITLLGQRNSENRRYIFQINLESAKI